jgi:hypothetical protein
VESLVKTYLIGSKLKRRNPDELLIKWLASENELENSLSPIEPPIPAEQDSPPILFPIQTYRDYERSFAGDLILEDLDSMYEEWPRETIPLRLERHILAWYQPIHFYQENWGVYILASGLEAVMKSLKSYCFRFEVQSNPRFMSEIKYAAWQILFLHEEFHHKVEMLSVRLAASSGSHKYRNYSHNVYSATKSSAPLSCREEAICDAYVYRNLRSKLQKKVCVEIVRASQFAMNDYMTSATGQYAGSLNLISDRSFGSTVNVLIDQINSGTISPSSGKFEWGLFPEFFNSLNNLKANTFLVDDISSNANLDKAIHLALPKRKLEKIISMHGYYKSDEGDGSHEKWKKPGSPFIILTKSREQSISVIKSTAKTLGMNVDELARETRNV